MKKLFYFILGFALILTSCKSSKSEDTPMPMPKRQVPSNNTSRSDIYEEDGFITGKIKSVTKDGFKYEKNFKHTLDTKWQYYTINSDGKYLLYLDKMDKSGDLYEKNNATRLSFTLNSDNSLNALTDYSFNVDVDSNQISITRFQIKYYKRSRSPLTLSNVVFDNINGTFSADYLMDLSEDAQPATVEGKIKTRIGAYKK